MTGYPSKKKAAQDKVTDIDGHVVRDARKPRKPPQRPLVDLTDEEISEIAINNPPTVHEFARAVLAKSKEKNNAA